MADNVIKAPSAVQLFSIYYVIDTELCIVLDTKLTMNNAHINGCVGSYFLLHVATYQDTTYGYRWVLWERRSLLNNFENDIISTIGLWKCESNCGNVTLADKCGSVNPNVEV